VEPTTVKCIGGNFCKFIQDTSAYTQNYGDRLFMDTSASE